VVITGGEPFIHKDLPRLCQTILDTGRAVSIETSGAFWQEVPDDVWVTLSPKQHISPLFPVQSQMWKRANEIKLVIEDGTEINYYERHLDNSSCPIFQLLSQRTEMRLSLQIHKFLNLR
jgi:organic radical activating enzyme